MSQLLGLIEPFYQHSSVDDAVRPVKPVDGSKTADGYGRVARVTSRTGLKSPTKQCGRAFLREATLKVVFGSTKSMLIAS